MALAPPCIEVPGDFAVAVPEMAVPGAVAGAPLAVMEVECRSMGSERCRFLLGSSETMQHIYDGMSQGVHYDAALEQMA